MEDEEHLVVGDVAGRGRLRLGRQSAPAAAGGRGRLASMPWRRGCAELPDAVELELDEEPQPRGDQRCAEHSGSDSLLESKACAEPAREHLTIS